MLMPLMHADKTAGTVKITFVIEAVREAPGDIDGGDIAPSPGHAAATAMYSQLGQRSPIHPGVSPANLVKIVKAARDMFDEDEFELRFPLIAVVHRIVASDLDQVNVTGWAKKTVSVSERVSEIENVSVGMRVSMSWESSRLCVRCGVRL